MKIFAALAALGIALAAAPACSADTARDPASDSYLSRAREVTIQALSFLGVNYQWGSANPERGFDCSGLVIHVFQQVAGMVLPRNSQSMSKVGEKIDKPDLQPGDLVFFNTRRQPNSHVGIYIGDERFVHAASRGGEVEISDLQESYWKKRFNGARRLLTND